MKYDLLSQTILCLSYMLCGPHLYIWNHVHADRRKILQDIKWPVVCRGRHQTENSVNCAPARKRFLGVR